MENVNLSHRICLAAAASLVGCGVAQVPPAASGLLQNVTNTPAIMSAVAVTHAYKVSTPLIYVTSNDETLTPLAIYDAKANNPQPIATISKDIDNSGGACIDDDGTLYVTNDASAGWVSEYALGHTKPLRLITKGISTPAYCAIDGTGNLWVTNVGADDVVEYLKGSTKPHATITNGLTYPDGIAIDRAGNLYVGNLNPNSTPNVQVYALGTTSPLRTITEGVTRPVGIAVDAHGTLYVANDTAPGNIEEYRAGQSKPYRTITDKLVYPTAIVVGKNGWLYVSVWGYSSDEQAILEFSPRSLKASSREITTGFFFPQGLAYYPPVSP